MKTPLRTMTRLAAALWLLLLCPGLLPAQTPGIFEADTSYSQGVVSFPARSGYLYRLWYNYGIDTGTTPAELLWELLPEEAFGGGQTVQWRIHPDMTPAGGSPPPAVAPTPMYARTFMLRAYPDGGTLVQWYGRSQQRMMRKYYATGFSLAKPAPQPAPPVLQVYAGSTAWTETTTVGSGTGTTAARNFWFVSALQGQNLPGLLTDDYDAAEQDLLDALKARYTTIKTRLSTPSTANEIQPPPPPPGIYTWGDHDPQQANRPRQLYKVERLRVDSDYDLVYDDVELADPAASPYDLDSAMAGYPGSGGNGIPNAYEPLRSGGVILNEVKLSGGGLQDEDGATPDWIELYNPTTTAVDLAGWQLRDGGSTANWFTFPAGDTRSVIPAGGYLLVFCRDTNPATPATTHYHTLFNLDASGETVKLYQPQAGTGLVLKDQFTTGVTPNYGYIPPDQPDYTFGRVPWSLHAEGEAALTWGFLPQATPLQPNGVVWYRGFCTTPTITALQAGPNSPLTPGIHSRPHGARYLAQASASSLEVVHYTVNGSNPSPWSAISYGYVDLSPETPYDENDLPGTASTGRSFVVRARTYRAGCVPSPPITRSFLFKEDVLGRPDDPATTGVDETEPPQSRPAGYPERSAPFTSQYPNGLIMQYGVQPGVASASRAQLMADLSSTPSIAITVPVGDFFDRDTGGIAACASATENGSTDPQFNGWERRCSMEWLYENNIQLPLVNECGLEVSGNTTLLWEQSQKRGLRLSFKKKYGPGKFVAPFPLFAGAISSDEYNELILKNPTSDSWQGTMYQYKYASYSREVWARNYMEAAEHYSLKARYIHVWVNGLYWGVYLLSEAASDDLLDTRRWPANWQVWKDAGTVVSPDDAPAAATAAWSALITAAKNVRLAVAGGGSGDAEYAAVLTLMDMDNFLDYCLVNAYLGNTDVLWNNGRMYRDPAPPAGKDSRIRWMIYDTEQGGTPDYLGSGFSWTASIYGRAGTESAPSSNCAAVLRDLSYHPAFRKRYGDKAHKRLFQTVTGQQGLLAGPLTPNPAADAASQRFAAASSTFNPLKLSEYLRWGMGWTADASAPANDWYPRNPAYSTDTFLPQRRVNYLAEMRGLTNKHYPAVDVPGVVPGTPSGGTVPVTFSIPASAGSSSYVIRYTTNGSDPSTVAFTSGSALYAAATVNLPPGPLKVRGATYTPVAGQSPPNVQSLIEESALVDLTLTVP